MTDRELLELAAKAAGVEIKVAIGDTLWQPDGIPWNPLDEDGDALRLAVKLGMAVSIEYQIGSAVAVAGPPIMEAREPHDGDPSYATRRAIVRAAAEIGRRMQHE